MDEQERLPCLSCGEPSALAARMCPHCGDSLLVDVTLRAPVADGRLRYRVARALQALPDAPPLSDLQNELGAARPTAAREVTRAFAHSALAILVENGLRGAIERPVEAPSSSSSFAFVRVAKATAALLLLVAMGYTVWERLLSPPEEKTPPTATPTKIERKPAPAAAMSPRELAQRSLPSTVSLRCRHSVGSGFFVAPDLVLTNAHVLCPTGESVQVVTSDERKFVGEVVRADETVDLGLVRVIGAEATPLPLGDVADLAVGDKVMIIGSPVGLEFTVHEGSVSSLQRSAFGVAYVQLDAKVNPGNSGGPVIDGQGRVVGVVSLKVAGGAEGIGLALPINYAYSSTLDFLEPPAPTAASSKAFARMLARAKDESGGQGRPARVGGGKGGVPDATEVDDAPLLMSAHVDQYTRLVVRLVRIAERPPGFEEVSVKMWSGTEAFCTIKGDVSSWTEIDPNRPGSGVDAQAAAMLKKLAGERRLYVGESPLRWDLCDRTRLKAGIEVELEGGSSVANRLQLK